MHTLSHKAAITTALLMVVTAKCMSAPVKTSKYPWINTWGVEYYDPDASTLRKDADHFDFHMGPHDPAGLKALAPRTLAVRYVLLDTQVKESEGDPDRARMAAWAASHPGSNVEDFYIHYKEDVVVKGKDDTQVSIPGWDPVNDSDGDGILDRSENPRATARTRADARVYYYEWQNNFYTLNVGGSLYRSFRSDDCVAQLSKAPAMDGFMADTAIPGIKKPDIISGNEIITEYPDQSKWRADFAALAGQVRSRLGANKYVIGNTAGYYYPEMADAGGGEHQESYVAFTNEHGPDKWDYLKSQSDRGKYSFWEPAWDSYPADVDRERLHYLAFHYMGQQPYVYLGFRGFGYRDVFKWEPSPFDWLPACEVDVGQPVDGMYRTITSGSDPTGQAYTIFGRRYSKSVVICRPKIDWNHSIYGDNTGVVYRLPSYTTATGTSSLFKPLKVDGTLGAAVSQVTLRNPESVILFPAQAWLAPVGSLKDTAGPQISGVNSTEISADCAKIVWRTDKLSNAAIDYGQTQAYGASLQASEPLELRHSLLISGLLPDTLYHYRVRSTDANANEGISIDYTFTTH
ncbi:MAG: fibronectin type III domain-containing protein [Armatimonadetes bacterium]|nr:fibronectin type III domain-containing protein [Armatimonadota bacterium]